MKNIILGLVFLCSAALNAQESKIRTFYVGDAKIACQFNNTITSCLKIKFHPDSNWKEFPYEINGFIFEPGVETMIEVEETPILFPEDNGPKYTYKMLRVIETKKTVLDNKKLLSGNKWKIINIEMDRVMTPSKKANAWMQFNTDSNTVNGFASCNSFSGNALIEDGVIQFGILNSTVMSCQFDEIEKRIMEGLKGKAAFYIRNNMLFVVCENHLIIHMRPEKRLDSMVKEINKPVQVSRGNTFANMQTGQYVITLDDVPEAAMKQMIFTNVKLTATEQQTIKLKLRNTSADDPVKEIRILAKPHKKAGHYYAVIVFKNGSKRTVVMRNVL